LSPSRNHVSPPNAFEYLFDGKSFKPHIASAKRSGIAARVVRRPAFGLDVDTVAELSAVLERASGTETGDFLAGSGIAERLRGRRSRAPVA
jgi:2-phospho-L-lactate guanylyltransferase (CobY/MobA/RfbA family)